MPHQFDSWESYFYPETYNAQTRNGVLRNIPDIRDAAALRTYDYRMSFARRIELELRPELVTRTFDGEHMKQIHGHLFGSTFEWAGQYRTVNMAKGGGAAFADAHNGAIDAYLDNVRVMVERTDWAQLSHAEFSERAAEIFSWTNQSHPFREGNGRTTKVFMEHVAERSPYTLEFERVPEEVWNMASAATRPPLGEYLPNHVPMVPVFEHAAVPRSNVLMHEGGRVTGDAAPEKPMTLGERIERKVNELREDRPSKPKHAADRGRDMPELGDGSKPKPPERGPSLGR